MRLLVDFARERGLSDAESLIGSGLSKARLEHPAAEIEARQELAVVKNLVGKLGHLPALGLEAGARYPLTIYGIWGYALLSSRTLRSALELGVGHIELTYVFGRVTLVPIGRSFHLRFDDRDVPEDCRRFLVERDMSAALAIMRALSQAPLSLARVTFRLPQPTYADRLREYFGAPVSFAAAENDVVIGAEVADMRLPQANEQTASLCEEQCRELLDRRRARATLAERVRLHLLRPRVERTIESVAAALAMSSRSLQRGLEAERQSFRGLVADVRRSLAEEMLSRRITVAEVSERLGYAETASFVHAFTRWTGAAPTVYRRRTVST